MQAEIVCIGTELLIGQVVNTNATFLSQELAALGIDVRRITTVGDNLERMVGALSAAWQENQLVVVTGGLGPTPDDLTIEAIAHLLAERLELRLEVVTHIESYFASRGRSLTLMDRKQGLFPPSATLIPNPAGTAFGVHVDRDHKVLMAFPGVPHELAEMWKVWAVPRLLERGEGVILSKLLKFVGISEADLAERVSDLLERDNPTVAPYAGSGEVHLRVSAKAGSLVEAQGLIEPVVAQILSRLSQWYFGSDNQTLPEVVGKLLKRRQATLATAESITGGLVASRMTDVSGSSGYFAGGVVAYTVPQKIRLLGLDPDLIARYGHVSPQTSVALAEQARKVLGTTWGLGVTGYAGPGPGVAPQRVGQVHVALAGPNGAPAVRSRNFGSHPRVQVKHFATQMALQLLLGELQADGTDECQGQAK